MIGLVRSREDLGPVSIERFKNGAGLELQSYVWGTDAAKAIVIAIHGITTHAKFEFLNHCSSERPKDPFPRYLAYSGSWPEAFNRNGIIFCSFDQQGHGHSSSWNDSRCNVESFDHFAFDALHFAIRMNETFNANRTEKLPVFILGVSMGGGVVLRTLQLHRFITRMKSIPLFVSDEALIDVSNSGKVLTNDSSGYNSECVSVVRCQNLPLAGGISMCPNLSLNAVMNSTVNRILLPLTQPASYMFPYARVGSLVPNTKYPLIEEDRDLDDPATGTYTSKLPARITYQNVLLGPRVVTDIPLLSDSKQHPSERQLSLVIIHSKFDTLTDSEGSSEFFKLAKKTIKDIDLWLLDDMWHCLTLETGNEILRDRVLKWITERSKNDSTNKQHEKMDAGKDDLKNEDLKKTDSKIGDSSDHSKTENSKDEDLKKADSKIVDSSDHSKTENSKDEDLKKADSKIVDSSDHSKTENSKDEDLKKTDSKIVVSSDDEKTENLKNEALKKDNSEIGDSSDCSNAKDPQDLNEDFKKVDSKIGDSSDEKTEGSKNEDVKKSDLNMGSLNSEMTSFSSKL